MPKWSSKNTSRTLKKGPVLSKAEGFTLLELLIVMAIIGILASIVAVNFVSGSREARDARRVREVYQIGHALQMYYAEEGKYPDNTDSNDTGCDLHGVTWDKGHTDLGADDFIKPILDNDLVTTIPVELNTITDPSDSTCLYRYAKVVNPCGCTGTYAILYAACEGNQCPVEGRPSCCTDVTWFEGAAEFDPYDILIMLKEPES